MSRESKRFPRGMRYDSCDSRKRRNSACLASSASISATPAPAQSSSQVSLRSSSIRCRPRSLMAVTIGTGAGRRHGPNGSFAGRRVPYSPTALAGFLLVNPRSGRGSPGAEELIDEAGGLGVKARILRPGEDARAIAQASSAGVLGVAGGDGSLAPVAEAALERGMPFVCIPFGTRNHFARDLGLDRDDPVGALRAFEGSERRVDVGRANGRMFLNNVSLGIYARLVRRRTEHRRRREAFARLRAWAILLTHREPPGITIDSRPVESRLVLVANNAYTLDFPSIGA